MRLYTIVALLGFIVLCSMVGDSEVRDFHVMLAIDNEQKE